MNIIQQSASEAWQMYNRRGHISKRLLRPHVYRAWQRSHLQKASHLNVKADQLCMLSTERLLSQKADLIDAARPYLLALSEAAGRERHAAMLGDEEAIILDVVADEATVQGPESFPSPGSILKEALSGANGIGSPLEERGYVELIATEHFIQGFQAFTCQGVPISGVGNRIVGVLSTSVRKPEASQRLQEIMIVAAKGIEAELLSRHLDQVSRQILSNFRLDKMILESLRQDVLQAYAAGRMNVELAAFHMSSGPKNMNFETGREMLKVALEAMDRFREQSSLCLELASDESGPPEPVDVYDLIVQMEQLLATEMRIRKVEFINGQLERIYVHVDRKNLQRKLLQLFLKGIQMAAGKSLRIDLQPAYDKIPARIVLTAPLETEDCKKSDSKPDLILLLTENISPAGKMHQALLG